MGTLSARLVPATVLLGACSRRPGEDPGDLVVIWIMAAAAATIAGMFVWDWWRNRSRSAASTQIVPAPDPERGPFTLETRMGADWGDCPWNPVYIGPLASLAPVRGDYDYIYGQMVGSRLLFTDKQFRIVDAAGGEVCRTGATGEGEGGEG